MKFGLGIIHSMVYVLVFTGPFNSFGWEDMINFIAHLVLGMAFGHFC